MSPHEQETRRRFATSTATLAASWDRYLDGRGPRAHGDLLRAVDGQVRAEAGRLLGRGHPLFEEVAQEALVGAARRIASGKRPEYPAAYLRKIVTNKMADLLERETRRRDREQRQWTPEIDLSEASVSADWHDFLDTLRTIVSSDEFWTLILRYHFDYSYGEIGDLLDKEPNAIRQIAHRGRRKCRDHLTRLEGRVPGWVLLPDNEAPSGGEAAAEPAGDRSGLREPSEPDPAGRSRRPPAGSDSDAGARSAPGAGTGSAGALRPDDAPAVARRRLRLRPRGIGRPFGHPTTVVPLVMVIALPILFQVDRAIDAAVVFSPTLTAELVVTDGPGDGPPPSGPTISVPRSTAPTAQREAPSTSAKPIPNGSDPPTTSTATADRTTTTGPLTTDLPTTTGTTTTTAPVTTPSTTPATEAGSTSIITTTRPSTTAATTTTSAQTTTTSTSTTAPSTTSTSTTITGRSSSTTTTGRDPDDGDDRPPDD